MPLKKLCDGSVARDDLQDVASGPQLLRQIARCVDLERFGKSVAVGDDVNEFCEDLRSQGESVSRGNKC